MDPWIIFAKLCQYVVEEGNVYLDISITSTGIEIMFMPMKKDESDQTMEFVVLGLLLIFMCILDYVELKEEWRDMEDDDSNKK